MVKEYGIKHVREFTWALYSAIGDIRRRLHLLDTRIDERPEPIRNTFPKRYGKWITKFDNLNARISKIYRGLGFMKDSIALEEEYYFGLLSSIDDIYLEVQEFIPHMHGLYYKLSSKMANAMQKLDAAHVNYSIKVDRRGYVAKTDPATKRAELLNLLRAIRAFNEFFITRICKLNREPEHRPHDIDWDTFYSTTYVDIKEENKRGYLELKALDKSTPTAAVSTMDAIDRRLMSLYQWEKELILSYDKILGTSKARRNYIETLEICWSIYFVKYLNTSSAE